MRRIKTDEEKLAETLTKLVADLRLDLEEVGRYLAINAPNISANRLTLIVEAMEYEKEKHYGRF